MFKVERTGEGKSEIIRLLDTSAGSSAAIAPNFGFNCFSFVCPIAGKPRDFLYAAADFPGDHKPSHHGSPILAPFPNRIRDGKFSFEGREFSLTPNNGPNAIHGFVIDQPWKVLRTGETDDGAFATGEFQLFRDRADGKQLWPADFRIAFTYRLNGLQLETLIEVENVDKRTLPFGVGTHPYFRFPLDKGGPLSEVEMIMPVTQHVELDQFLPTGRTVALDADTQFQTGLRLGPRKFDDVYAGIVAAENGYPRHVIRDHHAGAEFVMEHDLLFKYAVVYTPAHREAVCIEPYTCVTDAVNLLDSPLDTGIWLLKPGETRALKIAYKVRSLA